MPAPTPTAPAGIAATLSAAGPRAALAALNARTGCRYTALYEYADPLLHRLHFFDRLHPADDRAADDVPIAATYCLYVRRSDRPFVTADALADIRIDGHPRQRELRAYAGVPVRDADGRTVGSLCHFDPDPVAVGAAEMDAMEAAAALFAPSRRF